MSAYRSGADFERAVRFDLRENGYEVIRSAGSKTKVDLVAFKQGELVFVQCKRSGRIGPADRAALLGLAALVNSTPVVAARTSAVARARRAMAPVGAVSGHTGPRAARIAYARLTGPGAADTAPWAPDRPDAA